MNDSLAPKLMKIIAQTINGVICVSAVLILIAITGQAQTFSGRWQWKERAVRNKPQRQFTVVIHRTGNTVRGTYSVDEFINGRWQGEDGNQTAFRGRVEGKTLRIEFDPMATVPGYEQNVRYKPPADGRQPSAAVLSWAGSNLSWQLVSGDPISGVPAKVTLRRENRPKQ
jgi:hypothetical protein